MSKNRKYKNYSNYNKQINKQEKTKEELDMFTILFTGVSTIINLALLKGFAKAILHILF